MKRKKSDSNTKFLDGFTLIELLVVIAIIGTLASVVLASLNASRVKARNSAVLGQLDQFIKALDLYYANTGMYPSGSASAGTSASLRRRIQCIGDGYTAGVQCVPFSRTDAVNSQVEIELNPNYISNFHRIDQGTYTSFAYSGCSDDCSILACGNAATDDHCSETNYSLFYVLEGTEQNCGKGNRLSDDYNGSGYTWCQYRRRE